MEIISEPIEIEVADADSEPPTPEPAAKRRAPRAESKAAKPRVRKPLEAVAEVVVVPEVAPVEPSTPAPKARARKPTASAPAPAPTAPGISDVLGMLATALLDQRQARSSQRQAMYSRFLD